MVWNITFFFDSEFYFRIPINSSTSVETLYRNVKCSMFVSWHPMEKIPDPVFEGLVVEGGGVHGVEGDVIKNLQVNFCAFIRLYRVFIDFFKI